MFVLDNDVTELKVSLKITSNLEWQAEECIHATFHNKIKIYVKRGFTL